jgi:hypothetical protein
MRNQIFTLLAAFLLLGLQSCQKESTTKASQNTSTSNSNSNQIFEMLSSSESGVTFSNTLKEDSVINYFTYPYIYMGGGVAIGDINNDGLSDIYFTGNMVENALYLNEGDLKFKDITSQANVSSDDRWVTGVTMADVNADGWLDIYLSVSGKFTTTKNQLFLNDGPSENGIPTFTEKAEEFGIADEGRTTQSTFFDYDKDGDLDLYVANYPYTSFKTPNYSYRLFLDDKVPGKSDHLYQNNGAGHFKDVSEEAGILNFGLSLSATVGDFNNDGWDDLYVSNDFASPDFFYFNNGDGTFSEKVKETTQHTAFFGMGADAADFNNDGLLDILQMDMTPEDNRRNKANMASMNIPAFWEVVNYGLHYQYMQNTLQLNQGIDQDGLPQFSDIARMAGMSSTDWSWAGLLADLDNDGWKDAFITNGTRRDINNKDYFNNIENASYREKQTFNNLDLTLNMPSEKVPNYCYKNNGDLSFQRVDQNWGLDFEGFSNGAAYADLDNDGDLEMILNNIDDRATVYENKASDLDYGNYIRFKMNGSKHNPFGLGTKVWLKNDNDLQYQQLTLSRGFQSSVEPILHFGLGNATRINAVIVQWPDGKKETINDVKANQLITLVYENAMVDNSPSNTTHEGKLFLDVTETSGVDFEHVENLFNDFSVQVLIPHTYSANGPGLAVGDVNGDNLEDFYVGGAIEHSGALYVQQQDGTFIEIDNGAWEEDIMKEDLGATFFDADNDGDLDLYVVSGGYEYENESARLRDRLYLNMGNGNFSKSKNAIPSVSTSGSRVKAADFDGDGDLDLFVGGRLVPKSYPLPAKSTILRNEGLKNGQPSFSDVTEQIAPDLMKVGLVTDAVWMDFNQDNKLDLIVVGEWMPLTFLQNTGSSFKNKTQDLGMDGTNGWWYSIAAEDMDQDGDIDLIAGNLGLNYKYQATEEEPFDVYAGDFDKNGKLDVVLGYYFDGVQYPVRGRQCSSEQIPAIKYKYKDYDSFAEASLEDIYTAKDLEGADHFQAKTFASVYIENQGAGKFRIQNLPNEVQISSINGITIDDYNADGFLDLVVAGNLFGSEIETTRNDASYGKLLLGNGKGDFKPVPYSQSGLMLGGDVKDLKQLGSPGGQILLVGNNKGRLQLIQTQPKIQPEM